MEKLKILEGMRDFFYYGQKEHLKKAYNEILSASGDNGNTVEIDWQEEEFIFNKLFTGPMTPMAPAVASVYLDPEGLIQGKATREVREFYTSIGLGLEEEGKEPEDSLAFELDACRHLLHLSREVPEAAEAYSNFIDKHIALWVPQFSTRAMANCAESVAVKKVLQLLSEWVVSETAHISKHEESK